MEKICSKCGAETDYKGDLHCRNIFIEKINEFLSAKNFTEAKKYYFSQSFDKEWKEKNCPDPEGAHNALVDARWNQKFHKALLTEILKGEPGNSLPL